MSQTVRRQVSKSLTPTVTWGEGPFPHHVSKLGLFGIKES